MPQAQDELPSPDSATRARVVIGTLGSLCQEQTFAVDDLNDRLCSIAVVGSELSAFCSLPIAGASGAIALARIRHDISPKILHCIEGSNTTVGVELSRQGIGFGRKIDVVHFVVSAKKGLLRIAIIQSLVA